MTDEKQLSLFEQIGGKLTLEKVHKIFYDLIYQHPWIGQYFQAVPQDIIEAQQTDFMTAAMGGPQEYQGKFPNPAHKHMHITGELFDLRQSLLKKAIEEAGVPAEPALKWLKIDAAFRKGIVKDSLSECEKRYATDEILDFPNPLRSVA